MVCNISSKTFPSLNLQRQSTVGCKLVMWHNSVVAMEVLLKFYIKSC